MNKIRVCFGNGIEVLNKQSTFIFQLLYYFNIFILKIRRGSLSGKFCYFLV